MSDLLGFKGKVDFTQAKRDIADFESFLASKKIGLPTASTDNFTQANVRMTKAMRDSILRSEELRQENLALQNQWQKGAITLQDLTAKQKANTIARQSESRAAKEARKAQEEVNGSYFAAQAKLKSLGIEIKGAENGFRKMTPELRAKVREFNDLNGKLKEFDATMGVHTRKVGQYENALNGLKSLTATYLGATAILSAGGQIVRSNAEISDSLSDVRRTAGLTAIEAENLAEQLKKLDTRTSLKGLIDIATIGGQLGIAKDQLGGFTAAVDQLAVSLSGELEGGAEGIAKSLGVLDNVFGVTKNNAGDVEKSFNQIGSAILGLGQSGLATGDFLSDFGERVGGLAKQAGLSLPVILSYGAVLQENGVSAEVAGSSFKRLLSALTTNREKFFAVAKLADANLTLKTFTNTINTDAKKALDLFFAGLAKGGTTTTSFNDILKSLRLTGAGVSQTVSALSGHQESLNGHIEQATKDFNEASLSAEQFALKNENLAGSLEKFDNTITKITTSGRITAMFKGIVDGATNALDKFNNFVNSDSWKEFWTRLTNSNSVGSDIVNFTKSFDKVSRNNNANQQFIFGEGAFNPDKLKDLGAAGFNKYLENVKKTYDTALDSYANYGAAVQTGSIKEQKMTVEQFKFQAQRAKSYYDQLTDLQKKFGFTPKSVVKPSTAPSSANESDLTKAELKAMEVALNAQRRLQERINELNDKGKRKRLSDDDQEIEDVKAKYAKLRKEAEAFNNSTANKKKGVRVDTSGLLVAETSETDALRDKQAAETLKKTLDEQKGLYADFERFKTDFGEEKAKERYSKLINVDQTYLENLAERQSKLLGDDKAKGGGAGNGEFVEKQKKVLEEATNVALQEEQKRTDALLKEFMDYAEKRKILIANYEADKVTLENNPAVLSERTKAYEKDLKELDDANALKLESYEALFKGIDDLSTKSALKQVEFARRKLDKDILSKAITDPEEIAKIKAYFNQIEKTIREGSGRALQDLGNEISNVASQVGELNEEFGKVLSTIGNVVGKVGDIKKGIKDFGDFGSKGDTLGQLGAGLGILWAGISIFKTVFSLFDRSQEREEQAAYARDLQNKQTEAVNKALERQIALLDDAYGTDRLVKYAEAMKSANEAEAKYQDQLKGKYQLTGDKTVDKFVEELNSTGTVRQLQSTGGNKAIENFRKQLNSLPADMDALQRLLDEGKLDASTSTIVQNLIKANESAKELANNLNSENVGSSLSQIADDFITTLTDGTQDFGKSFEDTIRTSILNGFKGELIQQQLQAFYTQFADLSKDGGLSADDIAALRTAYTKAAEKAKQDIEDLEAATGIKLTGDKSSSDQTALKPNTLTASVNQPTAERLEGLWRGNFDLTKQLVAQGQVVVTNHGEFLRIGQSKLAALERIANSNDAIQSNTNRLEAIENTLTTIATNTKPVKSARD